MRGQLYFSNKQLYKPRKIRKEYNETVDRTWAIQFYLTYLVLRDKFDFNADQLEAFAEHLSEALKDCSEQRFTTEDIAEMIKEETGIDISNMMGGGK